MILVSHMDLLDTSFSHQEYLTHGDLFNLKQQVFLHCPIYQISMGAKRVVVLIFARKYVESMAPLELLEQEQPVLEKTWDSTFRGFASQQMQWCSPILSYWMQQRLQWDPEIPQIICGCTLAKKLSTPNRTLLFGRNYYLSMLLTLIRRMGTQRQFFTSPVLISWSSDLHSVAKELNLDCNLYILKFSMVGL